MLYHYAVITLDANGDEIPGTEHYAESVTKLSPGSVADAGCSTVKIMYDV